MAFLRGTHASNVGTIPAGNRRNSASAAVLGSRLSATNENYPLHLLPRTRSSSMSADRKRSGPDRRIRRRAVRTVGSRQLATNQGLLRSHGCDEGREPNPWPATRARCPLQPKIRTMFRKDHRHDDRQSEERRKTNFGDANGCLRRLHWCDAATSRPVLSRGQAGGLREGRSFHL